MTDIWKRVPNLDQVLTQLRGMHLQDAREGDGRIPQEIIETIVAVEVFNADELKPWISEVKTQRINVDLKASKIFLFYLIVMGFFVALYITVAPTYVPIIGIGFTMGAFLGSQVMLDAMRNSKGSEA